MTEQDKARAVLHSFRHAGQDDRIWAESQVIAAMLAYANPAHSDMQPAGSGAMRAALQYARNLIGPDEIIDAALSAPEAPKVREAAGEDDDRERWESCNCSEPPFDDEVVYDRNLSPRCPRCNVALGGDPMPAKARALRLADETANLATPAPAFVEPAEDALREAAQEAFHAIDAVLGTSDDVIEWVEPIRKSKRGQEDDDETRRERKTALYGMLDSAKTALRAALQATGGA